MSISNLSGPNYTRNETNSTQEFFNNFFQSDFNISPNVNDAIVSYFEKQADNKEAALALAASVIYTSLAQDVNPMTTLDEFKDLSQGELNVFLAMYLNLNRVGSSLLGVRNQPATNKYVSRTILP